MANYLLTSGAKFSPFTYQELLAPVLMATQAQQQLEDAYGELGTQASIWENMIDKNLDPELYEQQQAYVQALQEQSALLAMSGLSTSSRQDMLNMKQRYAREINPIEIAFKKREEDIARQKKVADATGGNTVFTRDAAKTRLMDYITGIDDYGQANLSDIFKEGTTGAAAISGRYLSTEEGRLFNNMYLNLKTIKGMSEEDRLAFLSNQRDENGNLLFPELHQFKDELLSKYNQSAYSDEDKERMGNAAIQGILAGMVYSEENKPLENWKEKLYTQNNMENPPSGGEMYTDPHNIYTPREIQHRTNINEYIKKGWIFKDKDGTYKLSVKGRNAANYSLSKANTSPTTAAGIMEQTGRQLRDYEHSDFRDFLDAAGYDISKGNVVGGSNQDKSLNAYVNSALTAYDANRTTEYWHTYATDTERNIAKSKIQQTVHGTDLYEVEFNGSGWIPTGNVLSPKQLEKSTVTGNADSVYGTVHFITDEDGKSSRYTANIAPYDYQAALNARRKAAEAANEALKAAGENNIERAAWYSGVATMINEDAERYIGYANAGVDVEPVKIKPKGY